MADYGIFRTSDAKRIAAATKRVEGSPRTYVHVPQRVPNRGAGGGDCTCVTVHELVMVGTPTGGTIILNVGVDDGSSVTTESVTLDYNESAAGALTAFEGHSKIASGDITVKGGPFPGGALYIVYKSAGVLNRDQPIPTTGTNSLSGGTSPHLEYRYVTNQDWEA